MQMILGRELIDGARRCDGLLNRMRFPDDRLIACAVLTTEVGFALSVVAAGFGTMAEGGILPAVCLFSDVLKDPAAEGIDARHPRGI